MRKVTLLVSITTTEVPTKDGQLSTLTKLLRLRLKDLIQNSDSTETDHSTLDPDFQ
jgi:hypothetical protein